MLGIFGVVLFWAGIWDGIGNLPYLTNPLISLAAGLVILICSALVFKEAEMFGGKTNKNLVLMYKAKAHPDKKNLTINYFDKIKNKTVSVSASLIKKIEKDAFLVLNKNKKEFFIPIHRIKDVLFRGKPWKPK